MEVRGAPEVVEPKPDERVTAALAHGLNIIAKWVGGIAAALISLLEKCGLYGWVAI